MKTIKIILSILAATISLTSLAQNRIDELVDQYSTIGHSTFSSTIVRDPSSRQATKVIKTLTLEDHSIGKMIKAFDHEAKTNDTHRKVSNDTTTIVITTTTEAANRIYMLKYKSRPMAMGGKATIIIKYNQKK